MNKLSQTKLKYALLTIIEFAMAIRIKLGERATARADAAVTPKPAPKYPYVALIRSFT